MQRSGGTERQSFHCMTKHKASRRSTYAAVSHRHTLSLRPRRPQVNYPCQRPRPPGSLARDSPRGTLMVPTQRRPSTALSFSLNSRVSVGTNVSSYLDKHLSYSECCVRTVGPSAMPVLSGGHRRSMLLPAWRYALGPYGLQGSPIHCLRRYAPTGVYLDLVFNNSKAEQYGFGFNKGTYQLDRFGSRAPPRCPSKVHCPRQDILPLGSLR